MKYRVWIRKLQHGEVEVEAESEERAKAIATENSVEWLDSEITSITAENLQHIEKPPQERDTPSGHLWTALDFLIYKYIGLGYAWQFCKDDETGFDDNILFTKKDKTLLAKARYIRAANGHKHVSGFIVGDCFLPELAQGTTSTLPADADKEATVRKYRVRISGRHSSMVMVEAEDEEQAKAAVVDSKVIWFYFEIARMTAERID